MKTTHNFSLYTDIIKEGDLISIEVLLNKWLPIWKECWKTNVNHTTVNMEILYGEMSPYELESMMINRMVNHTVGGGIMAVEECCDLLNDHLKRISRSTNLQYLVNKSLFILLMRRCKKMHRSHYY